MKYIIELNEEDVRTILAQHYGVPINNVDVNIRKQSVGYGQAESIEEKVTAVITGYSADEKKRIGF